MPAGRIEAMISSNMRNSEKLELKLAGEALQVNIDECGEGKDSRMDFCCVTLSGAVRDRIAWLGDLMQTTSTLLNSLPKEAGKILLVLFLSFLVGLEREEHKASSDNYGFGGVRTFPLIGLLGYVLALLSGGNLILPGVGLAVVGAFLWKSYTYKLEHSPMAGMTSEMSGLLIYAMGVLVFQEQFWIATSIVVIAVVLLELKSGLENLTKRVPGDEILTFAKFLLLSAVILPVVPNAMYGSFGFNPFKACGLWWWSVSAISYGSYLLQKATRGHGDIMLSAVLGGLYSSTLSTVVLAKRAKCESHPHMFSGAMVVGSGMMYAYG